MTKMVYERPSPAVSDFVRKTYPISIGWDHMSKWLDWAYENGFLGQIWTGDGLSGVAVARPVADVSRAKDDPYYFDLTGPILWIDISTCPMAGGLANLWYMAIVRFGVREGVAFRRNGGRVRMYDFGRFTKLVAGGA